MRVTVIILGLSALASQLLLSTTASKLRGLQVQERPPQNVSSATPPSNVTTTSNVTAPGGGNMTAGRGGARNETRPLDATSPPQEANDTKILTVVVGPPVPYGYGYASGPCGYGGCGYGRGWREQVNHTAEGQQNVSCNATAGGLRGSPPPSNATTNATAVAPVPPASGAGNVSSPAANASSPAGGASNVSSPAASNASALNESSKGYYGRGYGYRGGWHHHYGPRYYGGWRHLQSNQSTQNVTEAATPMNQTGPTTQPSNASATDATAPKGGPAVAPVNVSSPTNQTQPAPGGSAVANVTSPTNQTQQAPGNASSKTWGHGGRWNRGGHHRHGWH